MLKVGDYAITVTRRNPFYSGGKIVNIDLENEYSYDLRYPDGYGCNYKENELIKVNNEKDCYNSNS